MPWLRLIKVTRQKIADLPVNICVTTKEESGEDEQKSMSTKWKQSFKKDGDIARAAAAGELLYCLYIEFFS